MLLLKQAQANEVIVTLTEKQVSYNAYFLFVFTNLQNGSAVACLATDSSEYPERYNKFTITENSDPDALNAEVSLPDTGSWRYDIYGQASSTNIDPANADTLLETGEMKILATAISTPGYTGTPNTQIVFEG